MRSKEQERRGGDTQVNERYGADHKLIGRKIILKGVITVDSMYRSFEGQVENASFESFSQIMETEGNEDARCDLSLMRAFCFSPNRTATMRAET